MQPGTFELLILVFIFLGLQAWWIIPIVIKNNKLNNRGKDLREEITVSYTHLTLPTICSV